MSARRAVVAPLAVVGALATVAAITVGVAQPEVVFGTDGQVRPGPAVSMAVYTSPAPDPAATRVPLPAGSPAPTPPVVPPAGWVEGIDAAQIVLAGGAWVDRYVFDAATGRHRLWLVVPTDGLAALLAASGYRPESAQSLVTGTDATARDLGIAAGTLYVAGSDTTDAGRSRTVAHQPTDGTRRWDRVVVEVWQR